MERMIENLINGNIKDARKQAKSKSLQHIVDYLVYDQGWSLKRAYACGCFLKTGISFQRYCDITANEKE